MREARREMVLGGIVVWLFLAAAFPCLSETSFARLPADATIRDVLVDPQGGRVYLAVYDRNEVWSVDLAAPNAHAALGVGKGPSSLALSSDARWLACVNRLAGALTIIRLPSFEAAATVPCGAGAHEVAAMPDGRFAVSNSFADSLTLVDPRAPDRADTLRGFSGVPGALAASSSYLAVAVRVPPALMLLRLGGDGPDDRLDMPGTPVDVVALSEDRFVVATQTGLVLADARTRRILTSLDLAASAIAVSGDRIYASCPLGLVVLDDKLSEVDRLSLTARAARLDVLDTVIAAAAPAERAWYLSGVAPLPESMPTPWPLVEEAPRFPAPPADDLASPEPVAIPDEQVQHKSMGPRSDGRAAQEEAAVLEAVPAESLEPAAEPATEPASASRTQEGAETEPDAAQAGLSSQAVSQTMPAEEKRPTWKALQRTPLGGREVEAPRFSRRRPGLPGSDGAFPSISDALTSGFDLTGIGGGFEQPDWRQPWRDITADEIRRIGDREIRAVGNVNLTLDTLQFRGDELYYSDETGEVDARGNVFITQHASVLAADRVNYRVPTESEVEQELRPFPLTSDQAEYTGQEMARRRLSLGRILAEDVYLSEPYRELEAERLEYDFAARTGSITNAYGHVGGVYFGALQVRVLGPADAEAEEVWVTTCDHDPPHYRIRIRRAALVAGESFEGKGAQLQIGAFRTPLYWPRWGYRIGTARTLGFDFDSGRAANIGYYVNYAHHFAVMPKMELGLRLYPTQKQGVGFGLEGVYNFMKRPASPLFLGRGQFRTMVTTQENGYIEVYHRHEVLDDTVLLLQWEQWFDRDFVKDFYYEIYRHRTEPRTFANITYTQPDYIATATVRQTTNDFVAETERAPEATFHLLERPLLDRIHISYDTIAGYNEREPAGHHAARFVNVARATLDLDLMEAFSVTPFLEVEGTWYSHKFDEDEQDVRFSALVGATVQTRFHRTFPGAIGFSGFKHIFLPSVTLSYRPDPTMGVMETPRFDAYDNVYGRSRIETKIDNVVFGRDAETEEVWQVARLTLYQGNDFHSEVRKSEDYELELDLRPRPWWGFQVAAERHHITRDFDLDAPFVLERTVLEAVEEIVERPINPEAVYRYHAQYADYDRILSYLYYDDRVYRGRFNARVGFAYTRTQDEVFNREVLYGMGYKLGEKWSAAFEHRYDFERDELMRQVYEIRRNLHCWEAAVQFRERTEGWDIGFEMSLVGFPSTKVKF